MGFYNPCDCGEKVTLEISILMALTFYMNMVSSMMPESSQTPVIGIYFSCIMTMVASSTAVTILILNFHHRQASTAEFPWYIKRIFLLWLPWLLRMKRPGQYISLDSIRLEDKMKDLMENDDKFSQSLLVNVLDMDDNVLFRRKSNAWNIDKDPVSENLRKIREEMEFITGRLKGEDEATSVESEWKFAAMVLDRLCLIMSFALFIIFGAAIFFSAPQIIVK